MNAATLSDFLDRYVETLDVEQAQKASRYELMDKYPPAGFYVYALVDPRDNRIFYVGKGIGGRVLKHEERTRRGVIQNRGKVKHIQAIYAAGMQVEKCVLFVADAEELVLEVEEDTIMRLAPYGLENIIGGVRVQHPGVRAMASSFEETLTAMRQSFVGGGNG